MMGWGMAMMLAESLCADTPACQDCVEGASRVLRLLHANSFEVVTRPACLACGRPRVPVAERHPVSRQVVTYDWVCIECLSVEAEANG